MKSFIFSLAFFLSFLPAIAQMTLNVTALFEADEANQQLEQQVLEKVKLFFKNHEKVVWDEKQPKVTIYLNVKQLDNAPEPMVVIAVSVAENLHPTLVELGAEAEAMYISLNQPAPATITEEGRKMRKYMSREYMRQFVAIHNDFIIVVPYRMLDEGCLEVVNKTFEPKGE